MKRLMQCGCCGCCHETYILVRGEWITFCGWCGNLHDEEGKTFHTVDHDEYLQLVKKIREMA